MLFNSYEFIFLFLPISLGVFFYLGIRNHNSTALLSLTLASFFFYAWWNQLYVGLLILSIVFNYICGLAILKTSYNTLLSKKILSISIIINLALLGYFKYANFFISTINPLLSHEILRLDVILPLGISFFTFTQIAYLVDTFKGKAKEYNFIHYSLFVTYFPHLIAGPVLHHKEMMPQFSSKNIYRPCSNNFAIGITIFVLGLFKKTIIADTFSEFATPTFNIADSNQIISFYQAWLGALSYTLQLYFDFSGYSDMAIGLSRLFGIKLPINFDAPYSAYNIIDFWRRWHMTLSRFLKDYLYIPLGGNKKGELRRYINLFITMLLGGLWHGAGWTFLIWGALHGFYLIVNHVWQHLFKTSINRWWSRGISRTITLLSIIVAWVIFRSANIECAITVLKAMINFPSSLHGHLGIMENILLQFGFGFDGGYLNNYLLVQILISIGMLMITLYWPTTQQIMKNYDPALETITNENPIRLLTWQPNYIWSFIISLLAFLSILKLGNISEFLYFQF